MCIDYFRLTKSCFQTGEEAQEEAGGSEQWAEGGQGWGEQAGQGEELYRGHQAGLHNLLQSAEELSRWCSIR